MQVLNTPTLIVCPQCHGTCVEECCNGHMCPGTRTCFRCNGKGKVLSKEDAELKEKLKTLMEYK